MNECEKVRTAYESVIPSGVADFPRCPFWVIDCGCWNRAKSMTWQVWKRQSPDYGYFKWFSPDYKYFTFFKMKLKVRKFHAYVHFYCFLIIVMIYKILEKIFWLKRKYENFIEADCLWNYIFSSKVRLKFHFLFLFLVRKKWIIMSKFSCLHNGIGLVHHGCG